MSLETQSHIGCLIVNKVCGKYSSGYQSEIESFLSKNGPEWTTDRLKAIWNAALHMKSGCPDLAREIYQQNSISYHKGTLYPKGCIGRVVRSFVEAKKPSVQRRWASVLRFYTSLKLETVSKKQFKKHFASINNHPTVSPESILQVADRIIHKVLPTCRYQPQIHEEDRYADKLRGMSYYYSPLSLPSQLKGTPYANMVLSLNTTSWVPKSIDYDTPCYEMRRIWEPDPLTDDSHVGKISFLMEGGCKARVVAMPTAWIQLAFRPLHGALARWNTHNFKDESCVEHQESGIDTVLQYLQQGFHPVSVDLTAATDRLPLTLQCAILDALGLSQYSSALKDLCTKPWVAKYKENKFDFFYNTGQPMGLYGSFPLLNMTNCLLGRLAEIESYGSPQHSFRVVGDDIIFRDAVAADKYKEILDDLGVVVSPTKCRSNEVAEFAGFVVTPSGVGMHTAFRPYKVPSGSTLTNPVEFLHGLGVKVTSISSRWRRLFRAYQHAVSFMSLSLTPLIDEEQDRLTSTYRADNKWIFSLTNRIKSSSIGDKVPLSQDSNPRNLRVNRKPLFQEQRQHDFYGFVPEKYEEIDIPYSRQYMVPGIPVYKSIQSHPVLKHHIDIEKEQDIIARLNDQIQSSTSVLKRLELTKQLIKHQNVLSDLQGLSPERKRADTKSQEVLF